MKILYLIVSSDSSASGGHFRVLSEVMNGVAEHGVDTHLLNIGACLSPVIKSQVAPEKVTFIKANAFLFPISIYKAVKVARKYNPSILHAFDFPSLFVAKIIGKLLKIPVIQNKCGGPNYKYMPYSDDIIMLTGENLKYYKSSSFYEGAGLHFIPNRVSPKPQNPVLIKQIKDKLVPDQLTILKINRFSRYYKKSMWQTLALKKMLKENGINTNLLMVGAVSEPDFFKELTEEVERQRDPDIHLITEAAVTIDAAAIIDSADLVVGTGKGFMEAGVLGKVMFVPSAEGELPLLVTRANFEDVFHFNFSERVRIAPDQFALNVPNILSYLRDRDKLASLKEEMTAIYRNNFDTEEIGIGRYVTIYKNRTERTKDIDKKLHKDFHSFVLKMISITTAK